MCMRRLELFDGLHKDGGATPIEMAGDCSNVPSCYCTTDRWHDDVPFFLFLYFYS